MMGEGFMPPMMGEGFMPPMMGEGFMPPMMGEGFEIRESEIFKEIEQIFDSIIDSLASIEELNSVGSKATDEGISQSGELTLGLIEELIKETFDERIQEEIPELVDRVAKDAITQIIEGLTQANVEQSLEKTTESN
jgi:histone H3/H4